MLHKLLYNFGVRLRNPSLYKKYAFLKESESWSLEKLRDYQFEQLKSFLEFAQEHSEFYREHFAKCGFDARQFTHIEEIKKIPPVTKGDLIGFNKKVHTEFDFEKRFYCETSGTSGQVLNFWRDEEWDSQNRAAIQRGYSWYGVNPWDYNLYFWGFNFSKIGALKTRVLDWVQNRSRLFSYSDTSLQSFIRKAEKAVYIHGYSSMIYEVAKKLNASGSSDAGRFHKLKLIKGTSEKIHDAYYPEVQKAFNLRIRSEYGSAEAGIIAFECPEGNMHIHMEGCYVEEENGEIFLTNFLSDSFPIIRYKLGDFIQLESEDFVCTCGMKHLVLKDVEGRVGKNIYGVEEQYPSLTLYYVFKNLSLQRGVNLSYQGLQKERGFIHLSIEQVEQPYVREWIVDEMRKYFKNDISFTVLFDQKLRDYKGKFRDFISELD